MTFSGCQPACQGAQPLLPPVPFERELRVVALGGVVDGHDVAGELCGDLRGVAEFAAVDVVLTGRIAGGTLVVPDYPTLASGQQDIEGSACREARTRWIVTVAPGAVGLSLIGSAVGYCTNSDN